MGANGGVVHSGSRPDCACSEVHLVTHAALLCPICKSVAEELTRAEDARGFYCKTHGHFRVANSIGVDEYYTRDEWEAALRVAKYEAMEGEWPVIRRGDFFR
jgi:hypothetical protein